MVGVVGLGGMPGVFGGVGVLGVGGVIGVIGGLGIVGVGVSAGIGVIGAVVEVVNVFTTTSPRSPIFPTGCPLNVNSTAAALPKLTTICLSASHLKVSPIRGIPS